MATRATDLPTGDNPHDAGLKPSPLPQMLQLLGMSLFYVGLGFVFGYGVTEHWRKATFTLGAALVWLAALRLTCDSRMLGIYSVRSRRFDVLFNTSVGALMMFLAGTVDPLGS